MPLHSGKSPDRTKDGPRFAGRGFRLEKADGKCPFYTGWNAASDSLRAALRAVARWTPAAAGVRGRTAGKREETKSVSSLLSITRFPFRARFARKGK